MSGFFNASFLFYMHFGTINGLVVGIDNFSIEGTLLVMLSYREVNIKQLDRS